MSARVMRPMVPARPASREAPRAIRLPAMSSALRSLLLPPAALLAALAACAPTPRLVPEKPNGDRLEALVQVGELTLQAVPNAWRPPPASLPDHVTPLY